MPVTITVAELGEAIRLGDTAAETAEATRLLAYATEAASRFLGDAYDAAPEAVLNEAVVRLAGYLYDSPTSSSGRGFANALRNSGAGQVLLPYRVHRAGATTDDGRTTTAGTAGDTSALEAALAELDEQVNPGIAEAGRVLAAGADGRGFWDRAADVLVRALGSLTGLRGKLLSVNATEDGVAFIDAPDLSPLATKTALAGEVVARMDGDDALDTKIDAVRQLPAFPAEGSRDDKIPKFDGDTLGWEDDTGGTGGTKITAHTPAEGDAELSGIDIAGTDYELVDAAGRTRSANHEAAIAGLQTRTRDIDPAFDPDGGWETSDRIQDSAVGVSADGSTLPTSWHTTLTPVPEGMVAWARVPNGADTGHYRIAFESDQGQNLPLTLNDPHFHKDTTRSSADSTFDYYREFAALEDVGKLTMQELASEHRNASIWRGKLAADTVDTDAVEDGTVTEDKLAAAVKTKLNAGGGVSAIAKESTSLAFPSLRSEVDLLTVAANELEGGTKYLILVEVDLNVTAGTATGSVSLNSQMSLSGAGLNASLITDTIRQGAVVSGEALAFHHYAWRTWTCPDTPIALTLTVVWNKSGTYSGGSAHVARRGLLLVPLES